MNQEYENNPPLRVEVYDSGQYFEIAAYKGIVHKIRFFERESSVSVKVSMIGRNPKSNFEKIQFSALMSFQNRMRDDLNKDKSAVSKRLDMKVSL